MMDFKEKDRWVRRMGDDRELTAAEHWAGARLSLFLRVDTGQLDPTVECLIAATGLSDRAVRSALLALERRGWLRIIRNGRYQKHRYELTFQTPPAKSAAPAKFAGEQPAKYAADTPAKFAGKILNEESKTNDCSDASASAANFAGGAPPPAAKTETEPAPSDGGHCSWGEHGLSSPDGRITITNRQIAAWQKLYPNLSGIAGHIGAALQFYHKQRPPMAPDDVVRRVPAWLARRQDDAIGRKAERAAVKKRKEEGPTPEEREIMDDPYHPKWERTMTKYHGPRGAAWD